MISHSSPYGNSLVVRKALEVLQSVGNIWTQLWKIGTEDELFEHLIKPMFKDPELSGVERSHTLSELIGSTEAELSNELKKNLENNEAWDNRPLPLHAKTKCVEYALLETACTFAVQAMRCHANRAPEERQWTYVCEAQRYLGMLQGYISAMSEDARLSSLGRRGADARHAENRAMKAQLFEWCAVHLTKFKSLDAAAFAVAQIELPITFRTARSWIGEWKKLQSAGTL